MHGIVAENQLGLRPLQLPMLTYATHLCRRFCNSLDQSPQQEKCGEVVGMECGEVVCMGCGEMVGMECGEVVGMESAAVATK
jgi:hypothetical protein